MPYPETSMYIGLKRKSGAPDTVANLAAAAAQWAGFAVFAPVDIKRLKFIVTTQVTAGLVAPVVSVVRRPTYGSSSGAVTIAQMTIPNGAAAGNVYYFDVVYGANSSTKRVNAGEELSLEVKTQATDSGTAAGLGFIEIDYDVPTDQAANQTKMVLAAGS